MKILIVDDSNSGRELLQRICRKSGHHTLVAGDGQEALGVMATEPVDVIITDIMMPRMDGIRLCLAVRRDERLRLIPIIIYTAYYEGAADEKLILDIGADAFLSKPAPAAKLLETLHRVANQPSPERPRSVVGASECDLLLEYSDRLVVTLERRNAELERLNQTLSESEGRYRLLADHAEDFVSLQNAEDHQLYLSPSFYRVTGWAPEEIEHSNWRTRTHPEDVARVEKSLAANAAGEVALIEYRTLCKDGRWLWVEARSKPVCDTAGRVIQRVIWSRDITARKRAEAQLFETQKMEAIGQLAGGIAHDFNNILAAILGNVELARSMPPEDPCLPDNLDAILNASHRAADLVKQILAFSRRQPQTRQPVMLHRVIHEAVKLLRATVPTVITFQTELTKTRPVLADASQMHQVLINLCTNAVHAMRDRPGVIQIELSEIEVAIGQAQSHADLQPGSYVCLRVEDSGSGMDRPTMARIFDPFFTTKAPGEGTGLGLSVVHGIVKNHEGTITVDSHPGMGTVFRLFFPVHLDCAASFTPEANLLPNGHNEQILFVDDEEALTRLGRIMLQRVGYRVTAFTSVADALAAFRAKPDQFDLVITDLNMPVMNGLDFAHQLLQLRPSLPILLTTGYSAALTPERVRELGFRDLVSKPTDLRAMAETLQRVLAESPLGGVRAPL